MNRRYFASLLLLFTGVCLAQQPPTASVSGGTIRGAAFHDGGAGFLGIPYAQPPVGDLRWRKPAPGMPWKGVRDALKFGGQCAANPIWGMGKVINEDCLYLNIWTPQWPPSGLKPVMVWIHGGGNVAGSGDVNGESLMRHGMVVVSLNYRLGIFGFFAHPELTAESPEHASGNYGLMDQIEALRWVRDNIRQFGGDPGNVTIFGESAGAMDVNLLMTSPLAKGLFRRVIAESGSVLIDGGAAPLKTAEQRGVKFAEDAGTPTGASTLKYLRSATIEQLLVAFAKYVPQSGVPPGLGVNVDGWVIPTSPAEIFAAGKQAPVPLIIGVNSREINAPSAPNELKKQIEQAYGKFAGQALPLYGITTTGDGKAQAGAPDPLYGSGNAQWITDMMFRCPANVIAAWHSRAEYPTYLYQFERAAPGHEAEGAAHYTEVAYVFGTLDFPQPGRPDYAKADYAVSKAMQEYWTNFAKTGNPDGTSVLTWPRFEPSAMQYLRFTSNGPVPGSGLRRAQCEVFAGVMQK